jgi:choice-of-anchor B domain-containing protein
MRRLLPLLLTFALALPGVAVAHPDAEHAVDMTQRAAERNQRRALSVLEPSAAVPTERLSDVPCENGQAGPFACDGVDLLSFVPYDEFVGVEPTAFFGISDLWGWTDPLTGDEYVIVGKSNGTSFFRVTDPTNPVYLGDLPNTAPVQLIWHDVKVFENHAFIVSESNPHGMRVFDLTRLRRATSPQTWVEDARYLPNIAAHNIAINEETGYAYIVGGNAGIVVPDQCDSGLHMVDIRVPKRPEFAGCYAADGYTHDTQCVVYRGPDAAHRGKEICVSSNEDTVDIVDVTDKANPVKLGGFTYPGASYTHQGWLTEDQAHFVFGDETDERGGKAKTTRTLIADVSDLDAPKLIGQHLAATKAIDHNLYIRDGLAYQSNYAAGLRIVDTDAVAAGKLREVAFFDTFPDHDNAAFVGTWSNYPYFPSGTIAVSGIDEGLFLLKAHDNVLARGNG